MILLNPLLCASCPLDITLLPVYHVFLAEKIKITTRQNFGNSLKKLKPVLQILSIEDHGKTEVNRDGSKKLQNCCI